MPSVIDVNKRPLEKLNYKKLTKKGTATITCTVTDSNGNTVTDTCNVTVKYNFGQWLIVIILFGWIWY